VPTAPSASTAAKVSPSENAAAQEFHSAALSSVQNHVVSSPKSGISITHFPARTVSN
jgi:hypothetical protein